MEERLVEAAKAGDQEALALLLYNNYEIIFKYLIKFTMDRTAAEDMTQETMARAIEKLHLYNPDKSKFSTWLISIAQHLYIDQVRKRKSEIARLDGMDMLFEEGDMSGKQDESWRAMLDALARLPESSCLPLLLRHYYGYGYEEIAKMMKIPVGTVKSRIHNCLRQLRKELEADGQ